MFRLLKTIFVSALLACSPVVVGDAFLRASLVLDLEGPLKVSYLGKKGSFAKSNSFQLGLLGELAVDGTLAAKNRGYSGRLNKSFGVPSDREEALMTELIAAFRQLNPLIELNFLSASLLTKNGKPDFDNLNASSTPFLLVLKEGAGMSTAPGNLALGTLSAQSQMQVAVYDLSKNERISLINSEGFGPPLDVIDTALDDKISFTEAYPAAVRQAATQAYWQLHAADIFHSLAKGTNFEKAFPSISVFKSENAERFTLKSPKKIKGWKTRKTQTPYMHWVYPKKLGFNVITNVTLLAPELGLDFDSLDTYVKHLRRQQAALGRTGSVPPESLELFSFDDDWLTISEISQNGIAIIYLFKKQEGFVLSHTITVQDEKPIPLLEKYKSGVEQYINETQLILN